MKTSEIPYTTSRDYTRLKNLLIEGHTVVGFIALVHDGNIFPDFSRLIPMRYRPSPASLFEIGATIFERDLDKIDWDQYCTEAQVQYIDPELDRIKKKHTLIDGFISANKNSIIVLNRLSDMSDDDKASVRVLNIAIHQLQQVKDAD